MSSSRVNQNWRPQFGIRELLLATTLIAVVLHLTLQHWQRVQTEQQTAEVLTKAGGRVVFDTDDDWRNHRQKCFPPKRIQELVGKEHFQCIVSADLCGVEVTPERLQLVLHLKHLESLDLVGRETTDETLEQLAQVDTLRALSLIDTRVTSEGVERLKSRMPHLTVSWCTERDCGE